MRRPTEAELSCSGVALPQVQLDGMGQTTQAPPTAYITTYITDDTLPCRA
ncbi:MAG: hypothetical protein ACYC0E_09880 [Acidimicrobiales bacterium]